jgi:hypothetical protein
MNNDIVNKIHDIMRENIKKNNHSYIYKDHYRFDKIKGKTVLQSFFIKYPEEYKDCFNNLFDELHY